MIRRNLDVYFSYLIKSFGKRKKIYFFNVCRAFFIIYIIMQVKLNYGADFIRYTLFFYLLYFIALAKTGGKNDEDKFN